MRKLTFILLFLMNSLTSFAQASSHRLWEEGPLTWQDFAGKPFKTLEISFEAKTYLGYKDDKVKSNDTTFNVLRAYAYLERIESWVSEKGKNNDNLKYAQLLFNYLEIYKRKLQHKLYQIEALSDAEQSLQNINKTYENEIQEVKNLTDFGRDLTAVDSLLKETKAELKKTSYNFSPSVSIVRGNHGGAASVGMGYSTMMGGVKKGFGNAINYIVFDLEYMYRKSSFILYGGFGQSNVQTNFMDKKNWQSNTNSGHFFGGLYYGYKVYESKNWRFIPTIGIGGVEFTHPDKDNDNKTTLSSINIQVGIGAEYHFTKSVTMYPTPSSYGMTQPRYLSEWVIKPRLFFSPASYTNFSGSALNFSITIGYSAYNVKVLDDK
jgi:hypothetical protein